MKAEQKATAAVAELAKQRDDALADNKRFQKTISTLQAGLSSAHRKIAELEDRLYSRGASILNSSFETQWDKLPEIRAVSLSIMAKSSRVCFTPEAFYNARDPMIIVNESIDSIVRMHSDHVRGELQKTAFQACQYMGGIRARDGWR